jgi:hypothetical protein
MTAPPSTTAASALPPLFAADDVYRFTGGVDPNVVVAVAPAVVLGDCHTYRYVRPGGPRGAWQCHLCHRHAAVGKFTYEGGTRPAGFQLACTDCWRCFLPFFAEGCRLTHHETPVPE